MDVGDNAYADVIGAEQAGIPAILVHSSSHKDWRATLQQNWPTVAQSDQRLVRRVVDGLDEAATVIENTQQPPRDDNPRVQT